MPVVGTWRKSQVTSLKKVQCCTFIYRENEFLLFIEYQEIQNEQQEFFLLPGRQFVDHWREDTPAHDDRWRWKVACACTFYVKRTRAYHVRVARRLAKRKLSCCQLCYTLGHYPVTDRRLIADIFCICFWGIFKTRKFWNLHELWLNDSPI